MVNLIPLVDVLYVFDSWTLMLKSSVCQGLLSGTTVRLFDEDAKEIGYGRLCRYLSSKNPEISAIEIEIITIEQNRNMKDVKFINTA